MYFSATLFLKKLTMAKMKNAVVTARSAAWGRRMSRQLSCWTASSNPHWSSVPPAGWLAPLPAAPAGGRPSAAQGSVAGAGVSEPEGRGAGCDVAGCLRLWVLRLGRRCGDEQDKQRQGKQPGCRPNQRFTAFGSSRARATMRVESRMARVALAMLSEARETASTSTPTWNLSKMLLPLN